MSYSRRQLERQFAAVFTDLGDNHVMVSIAFRSVAGVPSRQPGIVAAVIPRSAMPLSSVRFGPAPETKAVASVNSWLSSLRRRKDWQATWWANSWPTGEAKAKRKRTTKPAGDEPLIAA